MEEWDRAKLGFWIQKHHQYQGLVPLILIKIQKSPLNQG